MGKPIKKVIREGYDRVKKILEKLSTAGKKQIPQLVPVPVKKY